MDIVFNLKTRTQDLVKAELRRANEWRWSVTVLAV